MECRLRSYLKSKFLAISVRTSWHLIGTHIFNVGGGKFPKPSECHHLQMFAICDPASRWPPNFFSFKVHQSNWLNFQSVIISRNVIGCLQMLANFETSWCISEVDAVGSSSNTLVPARFQSNWLNFRNIIISEHGVGLRPCWLNRKCHGVFPKLVVGDSSRTTVPAWLFSITCGQTFKTSLYPRMFLVLSRVGFQNIIILLFGKMSHGT